jgi:PAS domain S-box-containing protein
MHLFRDTPITRKLTLLFLLTSALGLLVVSAAILAYERVQFRQELVRELTTQAQIIAANTAVALTFRDVADARETLAALGVQPEILEAALFDLEGKLFATFVPIGSPAPDPPLAPGRTGHQFDRNHLRLIHPVHLDADRVGTLALRYDLARERSRLIGKAAIVGVALVAALFIALLLSIRFQRIVSDPILELARRAETVTRHLRRQRKPSTALAIRAAIKESGEVPPPASPAPAVPARNAPGPRDEVGVLAEAFTQMLDQIQKSDEAVRSSDERFRQLAESIHEVFWLTDPEKNHIFYVSPAYEGIWGRTCAGLVASPRDWVEAIHPDDRDRALRAGPARQISGAYDEEYRIVRPDGTTRWIRDRAFPVRNARGEVYRIAGIAEDITARKQAEEQRDRFFNLSLDLLCVADVGGSFLRVNPSFTRVLGYSEAELLHRPVLDFVHPEDRPATREAFARLGRGEPIQDFENRYVARDGSVRSLSWSCPPPPPGSSELYAVARDVTDQRAAQQALAASEERLRQVTENIDEVFWMANPDLTEVHYISPAFEKLTGVPGARLRAAPGLWIDLLHPEDRDRMVPEVLAGARRGEFDLQLRLRRPDGADRWVRLRAFPVRNAAGNIERVAGIAEDITERKRLEQEVLAVSEREQTRLGQDLHDGLCQHLIGAAFAANSLVEDAAAQTRPEVARLQQLARLLDDVITQARQVARGLYPVKLETEGLSAALQELAARVTDQSGVPCVFAAPAPVAVADHTTAIHLYRIAQEAVNNACKHARASRITLGLAAQDGCLRLTITDDGTGVPDRSDAAAGMGLHIMNYRAQMIGGVLTVERQPAGGTIICCSAPRKSAT